MAFPGGSCTDLGGSNSYLHLSHGGCGVNISSVSRFQDHCSSGAHWGTLVLERQVMKTAFVGPAAENYDLERWTDLVPCEMVHWVHREGKVVGKHRRQGNSPVVQRLGLRAFSAEDTGSSPCRGAKIPQATRQPHIARELQKCGPSKLRHALSVKIHTGLEDLVQKKKKVK